MCCAGPGSSSTPAGECGQRDIAAVRGCSVTATRSVAPGPGLRVWAPRPTHLAPHAPTAPQHQDSTDDGAASSSCTAAQPQRRQRAQQARYAPYCHNRRAATDPAVDARRAVLQAAIDLANQSLEAALHSFSAACGQDAGSAGALAALDAAEACMAKATRMTTVASTLAAGLLAQCAGGVTRAGKPEPQLQEVPDVEDGEEVCSSGSSSIPSA